jgi:sugar phosphate isomerase/epimerase
MALHTLEADRTACFQTAKLLGVETVIAPYLAPHERPADSAGWNKLADRLEALATAARAVELRFAWHNHDFEYSRLSDGLRPIDILLNAPGVCWEADVGWATRAQADPFDELLRYKGRLAALHAKDVAPTGTAEEGGWADVGFGTIDWEQIWPIVEQANVATIVVEHDHPADWRKSAQRSFTTLARLTARHSV